MPRVYLSSTYADLREHRTAADRSIRSSGFDCSAMEYYPSASDRPVSFCLDDVGRCDVYVGLFAYRYGFIPPGSSLSITEQEYQRARELEIPCLIFMTRDGEAWPPESIDAGPVKARVERLRSRLRNDHIVGFFNTPTDLAAQVAAALAHTLQEWPRRERARLLDRAVAMLRGRAYEPAGSALGQLVERHPDCAAGWHYRAIALFRGRSPQSASMKVVREAEQYVEVARGLEPDAARHDVLLAAIRHYYYHRNGLRSPSPTAGELLAMARSKRLLGAELAELLGLLQIDGRFT